MQPIILTILDGWGLSSEKRGNAIAQANTPTINTIEKFYPAISLQASGIAVGLPWEESGNSEVGHLNLGAGRIVYQSLPKIMLAIRNGSFFSNPAFLEAIEHSQKNNSCLHIMGLVSSGSVHSYIDHLYGLLELAKRKKVKKLRLHFFTDGKDSPPKEAGKFIEKIQEQLKELPDGKIATVIGRFYAMDRNQNWDRTQKAYECLVGKRGESSSDPAKVIEDYYKQGLTDNFIKPTIITDEKNKNPLGSIQDNDSVIFFNFRKDKARQIAEAFVSPDFKDFPRKKIENLVFVAMTQYKDNLQAKIAFPPVEIKNHLTEVLSNAGKKILKIAETEKYAHVTYFFNGGREIAYPNEERILIPSTTLPHYDQHPEMAAPEITQSIVQAVNKNRFDVIVVNYANTDMVGHTGNLQAAIKAVEIIDNQVKTLLNLVTTKKCSLIITADHGNAEYMLHPRTGEIITEHSTNPVPLYFVTPENKTGGTNRKLTDLKEPQGILSDITPTILEYLKIPIPKEISSQSLLDILK